ncbi:MAG: methylmalonyl-CoA mutase family protein [Chitinophagales bacterium]
MQALYAIYDNCNSLHTNAYDEAITTPTEERCRAMAIQLIINRELGTAKNENPNQGSFLIEELDPLSGRSCVDGVQAIDRTRRGVRRHGAYVSTEQNPGRDVLRASKTHWRIP